MLKTMVSSVPVRALASRIAWRSDPAPESLVFDTVNVAGVSTVTHAENSDVSPCELMAVAVTIVPGEVAKSGIVALPFEFVVTEVEPRNVCPSPFADGSHELLPKNCTVKVLAGMLLREPVTPPGTAVSTGQFWRLLGPVSASPRSFAVTPAILRSMPRFALPKIELLTIA